MPATPADPTTSPFNLPTDDAGPEQAPRVTTKTPGSTKTRSPCSPWLLRVAAALPAGDPDRRENADQQEGHDRGERDAVRDFHVMMQQHLHADEAEDEDEAVLDVAEHDHQAGDGEVQ